MEGDDLEGVKLSRGEVKVEVNDVEGVKAYTLTHDDRGVSIEQVGIRLKHVPLLHLRRGVEALIEEVSR